jgi:hypothetical protein
MPNSTHYRIDYLLHGNAKSFRICANTMDNAEAWHWATVDAGIGHLPKYRLDRVPKLSRPQAERKGITSVSWTNA